MIELVLRIGFSLAVVLGLMWGLARLARRPLGGGRGGGALTVLTRAQLTRGSSITVVRVADRALILGVTDQQVSVLGETDLDSFETQHAAVEHREPAVLGGGLSSMVSPGRAWFPWLEQLRERTVRR